MSNETSSQLVPLLSSSLGWFPDSGRAAPLRASAAPLSNLSLVFAPAYVAHGKPLKTRPLFIRLFAVLPRTGLPTYKSAPLSFPTIS